MHVRLTLSFITAIFILSLYVNLACEVWGTKNLHFVVIVRVVSE